MEKAKNSLHRYDVVEAEIVLQEPTGHRQKKKRPYVIVGNELGTTTAPTVIAMPLTHVIKRKNMPVHGCIQARSETGLSLYSMVLGEQPCTLDKEHEILRKLGTIENKEERNLVNRVCFNTMFYGENIDWKEVLA
ncbi:MAG: type II toxin-antitoxin system PemK/MazF family toxin [Coprobacillus sp.]|jgi:mRNA interferase MazF|nr:type II toxin-antitoxin system PemK/MazF family toxin [Coprobacillus sp.]DAP47528.1 MAG TPA: PemK-like protein [Caudoviricetes sp.]